MEFATCPLRQRRLELGATIPLNDPKGVAFIMRQFPTFITMIVATFVVAMTVGHLSLPPVVGANDASRWATTWSLAHGYGYIIDEAPYDTHDKVRIDGHFYSSKPPLLSTVIAGIYSFLRLTGLELRQDERAIVAIVVLIINIIPLTLLFKEYSNWLDARQFSSFTKYVCLLFSAFGTYLSAYALALNNHTVAACAVFAVMLLIERAVLPDYKTYFLAGLLVSWAVANELPALSFLCVIGYMLYRSHCKLFRTAFVPGVLLVALAYLSTTYLATRSLIPNYAMFSSERYHYPGSYWNSAGGIDAPDDSFGVRIVNFLVGHHGWYSLTPMFAVGLFSGRNNRPDLWRRWAALLTVVTVTFYAGITNSYGGKCQGPRWLIWLIPLWLIAIPEIVENHMAKRWFRVGLCFCLAISIFSWVWVVAHNYGPWGTSWLHQLLRVWGLTIV